ncbi:hypothetical protein, partial [Bradyrhizobium sp. 162]|uniref:hypothetical protein n=1 Tax=Bradyrhizobium sp. 162 TaxID=2782635 RepID=UPI001FF772ED
VGIAAMPNEPLAQPTLKAVETLRPLRRLEWLHPARRHVVLRTVIERVSESNFLELVGFRASLLHVFFGS